MRRSSPTSNPPIGAPEPHKDHDYMPELEHHEDYGYLPKPIVGGSKTRDSIIFI